MLASSKNLVCMTTSQRVTDLAFYEPGVTFPLAHTFATVKTAAKKMTPALRNAQAWVLTES
jgi:hypothetical protein